MSFKPLFIRDRNSFKVIIDAPWRMPHGSKLGAFLTNDDKMVRIYDEGKLVVEIDCVSGEIAISDTLKEKIIQAKEKS